MLSKYFHWLMIPTLYIKMEDNPTEENGVTPSAAGRPTSNSGLYDDSTVFASESIGYNISVSRPSDLTLVTPHRKWAQSSPLVKHAYKEWGKSTNKVFLRVNVLGVISDLSWILCWSLPCIAGLPLLPLYSIWGYSSTPMLYPTLDSDGTKDHHLQASLGPVSVLDIT